MNRRAFLKKGLLGGALLALGSGTGFALWRGPILYRPTAPLLVFDEARFNVMATLCARIVGSPDADPVALAHGIDHALSRAVPETRAELLQVLGLFDHALGSLLSLSWGPFTSRPPEEQERVLLSWRDSSLSLKRGAYRALKNLAVTTHYRQPSTWHEAGYPGPPTWLRLYVEEKRGDDRRGETQ